MTTSRGPSKCRRRSGVSPAYIRGATRHVLGHPSAFAPAGLSIDDALDHRRDALADGARDQLDLPHSQGATSLQHRALDLPQRVAGDGLDAGVALAGALEDEADLLGVGEPLEGVVQRPVALAPGGHRVDVQRRLERLGRRVGDVVGRGRPLPRLVARDRERLIAQDRVQPRHELARLGRRRLRERDDHRPLVRVLGILEGRRIPRREPQQARAVRHGDEDDLSALVAYRWGDR